jgi:hypothetical protein
MAYTVIDNPGEYFNTVIWSGDGVDGRAITTGFQTNWTWIKRRNATNSHIMADSVRGATYKLNSSDATAEVNNYDGGHLESFTSTGFTMGIGSANFGHINLDGGTYVGWNWRAETAFSNDASATSVGSIDSVGTVNTDAGFSIVSWTGTGANATVSHGLGSVPKTIIVKNRDSAENWIVGHNSNGWGKYLTLNTTDATSTASNIWQDTAPSSSIFTIGASGKVNGSSHKMIAYCFADVKGYSKMGSYVGNGNANGPFIYLGFKPAMVIYKRASDGTNNWGIIDNKRDTFNPVTQQLHSNLDNAEGTASGNGLGDFLSNGWKIGVTSGSRNASGSTYIYMAFAENPFVTSTGIPGTAR